PAGEDASDISHRSGCYTPGQQDWSARACPRRRGAHGAVSRDMPARAGATDLPVLWGRLGGEPREHELELVQAPLEAGADRQAGVGAAGLEVAPDLAGVGVEAARGVA